jgi:hypothetical protein
MRAKTGNRTEMAQCGFRPGQGRQNHETRSTEAFKGVSKRPKSITAKSKADLEMARAKEAKEGLIAALENALAQAPTLERVLKRACSKIAIRVPPGGVFKIWNYVDAIECALKRARRIRITGGKNYRENQPTRAEGRRSQRQAKRLARCYPHGTKGGN